MMKYMSVGLIMTAGIAISATLANGYSQIRAEAEAHAVPTALATLKAKQLSGINNKAVEKFHPAGGQLALNNRNRSRLNVTFDVLPKDQDDTLAILEKTEADYFTSLQDSPQSWLLLKYPQSTDLNPHAQPLTRLETIPVANVGGVSRELLPAVYQFTHRSEDLSPAEETDADSSPVVRYKF